MGRKISAFISFQVEIAVGIREQQFDIYRSQSVHMPTYAEVKNSFEVLNFIHSNHIHSLDDTHEFSFIGFKSAEEREIFCSDWENTVNELVNKLNGKYPVQNDVSLDNL